MNKKAKIFINNYQRQKYLGVGIYLGEYKIWHKLNYGLIELNCKAFLINNGIIFDKDCKYKFINEE